MSLELKSFLELRGDIDVEKLIEMNSALTYDDVGIAMMEYVLRLCHGPRFETEKVNESSQTNFIETLLKTTILEKMLPFNRSGRGYVQKPDAVFLLKFSDIHGNQKQALVYYESDGNSKDDEKSRKQIARKIYQSTCGCAQMNTDMPAITVRANVFSGPKPNTNIKTTDADFVTEMQYEARGAIDFLLSLCISHLWVAHQIMLLVNAEGILHSLTTHNQVFYDHHIFIGAMRIKTPNVINFFTPSKTQTLALVNYNNFVVADTAAAIQIISLQRFDQMLQLHHKLPMSTWNSMNDGSHIQGMPTLQQIWAILAMVSQSDKDADWKDGICKILGKPDKGLSKANITISSIQVKAFELSKWTNEMENYRDNIVAYYYDSICYSIYNALCSTNQLDWKLLQEGDIFEYLPSLKQLKVQSKRNLNGMKARGQSQTLTDLMMTNDIGITNNANCLNSLCLLSLDATLPHIDKMLKKYIDRFNAPNVVLFLRMIRCTNLMALEHLSKNYAAASIEQGFTSAIRLFPVGTIADIDYITKYTLQNYAHIHSLFLTENKRLSTPKDEGPEKSTPHQFVQLLVDNIMQASDNTAYPNFDSSPLYYKLLLCAHSIYNMVFSMSLLRPNTIENPVDDPVARATSEDTLRKKRIALGMDLIRTMACPQALYYMHDEDDENCVAIDIGERMQKQESYTRDQEMDPNHDHAKTVQGTPILLTWPQRDMNIFRGCSKKKRTSNATTNAIYYEFPYLRKFYLSDSMHVEEEEMFKTMLLMQEIDSYNRQIRRNNFEVTGPPKKEFPTVKPTATMKQVILSVEDKYIKQRQKCTQWSTHQDQMQATQHGHSVKGEVASNDSSVNWTWQWKRLLIKLTLVKALNGIYVQTLNILLTRKDTSYGEVAQLQGPESLSQKLQGDNFALQSTNEVCRWHGKNHIDCHKTDPTSTVPSTSVINHQGQFLYTKRKNADDNTEVNILKCTFGDKIRLASKKFVNEVLDINHKAVRCVYQSTEVEKTNLILYYSSEPLDKNGTIIDQSKESSKNLMTDWFSDMASVDSRSQNENDLDGSKNILHIFRNFFA